MSRRPSTQSHRLTGKRGRRDGPHCRGPRAALSPRRASQPARLGCDAALKRTTTTGPTTPSTSTSSSRTGTCSGCSAASSAIRPPPPARGRSQGRDRGERAQRARHQRPQGRPPPGSRSDRLEPGHPRQRHPLPGGRPADPTDSRSDAGRPGTVEPDAVAPRTSPPTVDDVLTIALPFGAGDHQINRPLVF